jgi:tetratricopeptide (TPR) repeat protein
MQQGRECLARGEYRTAVRVLEAQLPKINGNATYLGLLEVAYRGYVKELQQKGKSELAQRYLERLAILDPGVKLAAAVRPSLMAKEETPAASLAVANPGKPAEKPEKTLAAAKSSAQDVLVAAEREFQARHYYEAAGQYQRAFELDQTLSPAARERWAYCKLHAVTEQINNPPPQGLNWTALEHEVQGALRLAPRLEYGQTLLKTIQERSRGVAPPNPPLPRGGEGVSKYGVQHHARKHDGWQIADSANFRVFHHDPELAEKALQVAEETRAFVAAKWLGGAAMQPWAVRCDIYLHPTGEAYCRATGTLSDSPGHSSIGAERDDASRIHSRRIDLHVDDPFMLPAVLPHEATHVVLAGHFGRKPLPRWADEGLAILSEPPERIARHTRILPRAYQEGRVFGVAQLLELEDYPHPQYMDVFYGQSASIVQYLSDMRGPHVFAEFLRSAPREGYEAGLRRHYGLRNYAELEQRWTQAVFAGKGNTAATDKFTVSPR